MCMIKCRKKKLKEQDRCFEREIGKGVEQWGRELLRNCPEPFRTI